MSEKITDTTYVIGFGEEGFGEYTFGGSLNLNNITDLRDEWDNDAIKIYRGEEIYDFLDALVSELYKIDADIDAIYDDKFVGTATGDELDRLGKFVQTPREYGESDDRYRRRIRAAFAIQSSDTTYEEFVTIVLNVLDTEADEIDVYNDFNTADATIYVEINGSVIDNVPFTASEIKDLLVDAVPAGHDVKVVERGTLELISVGGSASSGTGLSSTSTTNGTLSGLS